jgi:hypothetical protein
VQLATDTNAREPSMTKSSWSIAWQKIEINCKPVNCALPAQTFQMFTKLADFDLEKDYAAPYTSSRNTYLKAAAALKLATGPYKAARDAYVAATATYTKSLYE